MKKKMMIALPCVLALGLTAAAAGADPIQLSVGDNYFVGTIVDSIPSDPADEIGYIQNLITLSPGDPQETIGTEQYNRVGSTLVGTLPDPGTFPNATQIELPDDWVPVPIDVTGVVYILAKYDAHNAGALVWMVRDLVAPEGVLLPATFPGAGGRYGISHYTLVGVPDGGVTLMLLGGALLGLGGLRRKFSK